MGKHVEVIARGVCVCDGSILLCQTKGADNTYLPGGHVDFGESARTALEREIDEELGQSSTAERFLGAVEHAFLQKGKPHCEWNVVFALSIPGLVPGDKVKSAEDHIKFRWCKIDALKTKRLQPAVLCDLLPQWLSDTFPGDRWASGGDFA